MSLKKLKSQLAGRMLPAVQIAFESAPVRGRDRASRIKNTCCQH